MVSRVGLPVLRVYRLALAPLLTIFATTAFAASVVHEYLISRLVCMACQPIPWYWALEKWLPLPFLLLPEHPLQAVAFLTVIAALAGFGLRFALSTRWMAADRWANLMVLRTADSTRWRATLLNTAACTCLVVTLVLVSIATLTGFPII